MSLRIPLKHRSKQCTGATDDPRASALPNRRPVAYLFRLTQCAAVALGLFVAPTVAGADIGNVAGDTKSSAGTSASTTAGADPATKKALKLLVLRENGVGTAKTAQRYVDALMARLAAVNGWASATGYYATRRSTAESWITANHPEFALMTLPAYLALAESHRLKVVGSADVPSSGGRRYHIVSAKAKTLNDCVGQSLSTNHAGDPAFIDRVVAKGAFTLASFKLVATRRPMQTLKKVIRGEALCALVDDAQFAQIGKLRDAASVQSLWQSAKLPPMVLVAFPSASSRVRSGLQAKLAKVCRGEGKQVCDEAGIKALVRAGPAKYRPALQAYQKSK